MSSDKIVAYAPDREIGKKLFELADKQEKQTMINSAVGIINSERNNIRSNQQEMEKFRILIRHSELRLAALASGEFTLDFRGQVNYEDDFLNDYPPDYYDAIGVTKVRR